MKQIDLFEELEAQDSKRLVKNVLKSFEYRLLDYLKNNCVGRENALNGYELGKAFGVDSKKIRYHIARLRKHQSVVIGSHIKDGYYIPLAVEKKESLRYAESKVLSEVEARIRQNPDFLLTLYKHIHIIKHNLEGAVQGQITIQFNGWEKDYNRYGDKYIKEEV